MNTRYTPVSIKLTRLLILVIGVCGIVCAFLVYLYANKKIVDIKRQEFVKLHSEKTTNFSQKLTTSLEFARLIAVRTRVVEYLEQPSEVRHDELVSIFDQYPKDNPDYLAVYLLDASGSAVISTDRSLVGNNYAFRAYFQNAISGTPYMDAVYGVTTNQLGFYFAYPVVGTNGTPIGVMAAKRAPESVYQNIITADMLDGGSVMVTDEYGIIIHSNKEERLFQSIGPLSEEQRAVIAEKKRYGTKETPSSHYVQLQEYITQKRQSGVFDFHNEDNNKHELLSIQKVGSYPFYFVYEIDVSYLEVIALQIVGILLLMVVICVVLAMILMSNLMKKMLLPLTTLKNIAERASGGDINQEITLTTHDEFESVAIAFTTMFSKLREFTGSLDKKVKEQTASLEEKAKELEDKQKAMLNVLEDINAEKTKSQMLAEDLQKFKLAVVHASDHIVITDPEGIVLYANEAVSQITGFSTDEVIGNKVGSKMLWGGQMATDVYRVFWKTIKEEKKVFIGEFTNHRKNGQEYIAEAHVAPILDDNGNVRFFVGIERDITHAKEVDRMKTEFISLASHQLRTPLSAMKWFGEMLLAGDAGTLTPEQKEYIGNIDASNERMIALVNSLLNISRIESGRIIIDPKPTNIEALVQSVVKELKMQFEEKKLQLVMSIHTGLPTIMLDPKLIFEVYKNLLTNAIKYTPVGGEITILVSKKGDTLLSQVTDTGYGIPKVEHKRVFERFYRGQNIIKLETDGTGLGLYLVKAIIDSSGGKIWFESEEGKGTTLWFSLPMSGMKKKEGEVTLNT